ncbi:hypothetical protein HDU88_004153 [Geranomyces variabilis]|nr:hypothetical protein HDU88_004153 [Geranomyces variabilis]
MDIVLWVVEANLLINCNGEDVEGNGPIDAALDNGLYEIADSNMKRPSREQSWDWRQA